MLRGRHVGWSPSEPESDPWRLLVLAVVRQAVEDLTAKRPDPVNALDPAGARAFLLQDAPDLLEVLGLGQYASRLLALINATPEPETLQLPLFLEEVA